MDEIINNNISDDEIDRQSKLYDEAKAVGGETEIQARFSYAYALIKSRHKADKKRGIQLLESLFQADQSSRRDYLYYVAIGHTRLGNYPQALDCVNNFLRHEPDNHQAKQLQAEIERRLRNEGFAGMAIAGGAALIIGGLISLGMSMSKK